MKARDGDTQTKKRNDGAPSATKDPGGICAKCKTPVPAKAGFRLSSLKCPKCGKVLGRT